MEKVKLAHRIWTIDDFLCKESCEAHIQKSEEIGYELAKVNLNGVQTVMTSVRNNQRVLLKDEELAAQIWEKLKSNIEPSALATPIGLNELWRYYKYEVDETFKPHRDGSYVRNTEEMSFLTFLIYLNDDFEGGETGFGSDLVLQPKTGRAVIFDHRIIHEGKPILNGTKYVLRTDVMFRVER